jgi:hypothetical protein
LTDESAPACLLAAKAAKPTSSACQIVKVIAMKCRPNRKRLILATAVASAAFALFANVSTTSAQYRVDNGNARDANNRVGSGGFNQTGAGGGSTSPYAVNGNNIVTGNVTAGREFRGFVPYTDPGAFRGQTAGGNVDRFVRSSAGVPVGVYGNNNAGNILPFFGDARGVAPPTGFVEQAPGQTGYVPGPMATRTTGDLRLGNPFETIQVTQPRPGQLVLPGPVDASQQPTVITASPLYGVRQWKFGDQADQQFLENYTDVYNGRRNNQFDTQTLERMRNEISQQVEPAQLDPNDPNAPLNPNNQGNPAAGGGSDPRGSDANGAFNSNMNPAMNPLSNDGTGQGTGQGAGRGTGQGAGNGTQGGAIGQLQNQQLNSSVTNQALGNDIGRTKGMRNRLLTLNPTAAATSPQYRALQDRLRRRQSGQPQLAEVEANREFRAQQLAAEEAAKAAGQGGPGAPGGPNQPNQGAGAADATARDPNAPALPGAPAGAGTGAGTGATPNTGVAPAPGSQQPLLPGVAPGTPQTGNAPAAERPVMIKSFTEGMKDSAVVNLMKEAEQLMRDGKYTTALDRYDMAEQVVPNDPLVLLGRATAELGASYYTRADGHLREALTKNPALLMGQYDLHTFLGDERLAFLVKDLKDLANRNKQDSRPVFLLSYIAYNTGNERNAAAYLDLAEKRAGGKDSFFATLRKNWSLPEGGAAPDVGGGETGGASDMNK